MDADDARAGKLLGDLLALVMSEHDGQAEAAIGAIRRRAERDGVTAGALKRLVAEVLGRSAANGPNGAMLVRQVGELQWRLEAQEREMAQMAQARRRAEREQQNQARLTEATEARLAVVQRARWSGWRWGLPVGALAGVGLGVLLMLVVGPGGTMRAGLDRHGMDRVARARLADFLHGCFLSSSNSLAGRAVSLRVLVDVDEDGRIVAARLLDRAGDAANADETMYGQMVIRTFASGSCGALPLPASLRGHRGQFVVVLAS